MTVRVAIGLFIIGGGIYLVAIPTPDFPNTDFSWGVNYLGYYLI
jgi:hypothetical protein